MTDTDLSLLRDSATRAAQLMKSMSNPHRLLVLCMLIDSPGTSAGELSRMTGLSASATSQHLSRMKEEQLIESRREAQRIHYFIKDPAVLKIVTTLKAIYCP